VGVPEPEIEAVAEKDRVDKDGDKRGDHQADERL